MRFVLSSLLLVLSFSCDREPSAPYEVARPSLPTASASFEGTSSTSSYDSIRGRVIDADGVPVSGARVWSGDSSPGWTTTTDENGAYEIPLPPRSRTGTLETRLSAEAEGFCGPASCRVPLPREGSVEAPSLRLWKGGELLVIAQDQKGVPVRAELTVAHENDPDHALEAISLPGAPARLGPLPPGILEGWITSDGVGATRIFAAVAEGERRTIEVVLDLPFHLSGRVVDAAGTPLEGVTVLCRPEEGVTRRTRSSAVRRGSRVRPSELPRGGIQETDEYGAFSFYGLDPKATYTAWIPSANSAESKLVGLVPTREDLVLVAPRPGTLEGVVVDSLSQSGIAGCSLQLVPSEMAPYTRVRIDLATRPEETGLPRTDAEGRFVVEGLFPGGYVAFIFSPDRSTTEVPVRVASGKVTRVNWELGAPATLSGTVSTSSGVSKPGAVVCVRPLEDRGSTSRHWTFHGNQEVTADPQGRYRFSGLPIGQRLVVTTRDGSEAASVVVELRASEHRVLDLVARPFGALRVQLAGPSGALPGFAVRLEGTVDPSIGRTAITDDSGEALFSDLVQGAYRVRAVDVRENPFDPGVQSRVREIFVAAGREESLSLPAPDLVLVSVDLREADRSVAMARIDLGPRKGTRDHYRPQQIEVRDGEGSMLLPPGEYSAVVRVPGRRHVVTDPIRIPEQARFQVSLDLSSPGVSQ